MSVLVTRLSHLHHFDANGDFFERKDVHILINKKGIVEKISDQPITQAVEKTIDGTDLLGLPAFIDCHSHSLFGGNRSAEFEMKCQGKSYAEIAQAGGGILSTQKATQAASDEKLTALVMHRIELFKQQGVYGLEIKTGYGLSHDEEVRHLRILRDIQSAVQAEFKIWVTYMGAHAVPKTREKTTYLEEICTRTIPLIAEEKLADFVDIFVDEGFFDAQDLARLHKACQTHSLPMKAHIDEIKNVGASMFAAEQTMTSVEHCRHTTMEQLSALAKNHVQAVYLPVTSFYINEGFVSMRDIRKTGMKPAISLDYNPGSQPALSWPLLLHMGMKKMNMTQEEMLYATTIAPLHALNESVSSWALQEGNACRLTLFRAAQASELAYRYGENLFQQGIVSYG